MTIDNLIDDFSQRIDLELLQNADDSGAKNVEFILDLGQYRKDHLIYNGMGECQGPALLVYNDGMFTDKDFKSIISIGNSSKGEDEKGFTTGKFGIGFNSVYHITDYPTFISSSKICVFNPSRRVIPKQYDAGIQIDFVDHYNDLIRNCKDSLDVFTVKVPSFDRPYEHTLFRLPLRTPELAKTIENTEYQITSNTYTPQSMLESLFELGHELENHLIFLKNILSIKIGFLNENHSIPCRNEDIQYIFESSVSNISDTLIRNRNGMKESIQNIQKNKNEKTNLFTYDYTLSITTTQKAFSFPSSSSAKNSCVIPQTTSTHTSYYVCSQFGSLIASPIDFDHSTDKRRRLPWGAVAGCLETDKEHVSNKGYAYCFLPLPITTESPIHVNGYFDLSDNRREMWYDEETELRNDPRCIWNIYLLRGVVAPCYIRFMKYLANLRISSSSSKEQKELFNHYLPLEETRRIWRVFMDTFKELCINETFFFDYNTKKLFNLFNYPYLFIRDDIQQVSERNAEKNLNELISGFEKCGIQTAAIDNETKQFLTSLLATNQHLLVNKFLNSDELRKYLIIRGKEYINQLSTEEVKMMLSYCLMDINSNNLSALNNLCLLPLQNNTIGSFLYMYTDNYCIKQQLIDRGYDELKVRLCLYRYPHEMNINRIIQYLNMNTISSDNIYIKASPEITTLFPSSSSTFLHESLSSNFSSQILIIMNSKLFNLCEMNTSIFIDCMKKELPSNWNSSSIQNYSASFSKEWFVQALTYMFIGNNSINIQIISSLGPLLPCENNHICSLLDINTNKPIAMDTHTLPYSIHNFINKLGINVLDNSLSDSLKQSLSSFYLPSSYTSFLYLLNTLYNNNTNQILNIISSFSDQEKNDFYEFIISLDTNLLNNYSSMLSNFSVYPTYGHNYTSLNSLSLPDTNIPYDCLNGYTTVAFYNNSEEYSKLRLLTYNYLSFATYISDLFLRDVSTMDPHKRNTIISIIYKNFNIIQNDNNTLMKLQQSYWLPNSSNQLCCPKTLYNPYIKDLQNIVPDLYLPLNTYYSLDENSLNSIYNSIGINRVIHRDGYITICSYYISLYGNSQNNSISETIKDKLTSLLLYLDKEKSRLLPSKPSFNYYYSNDNESIYMDSNSFLTSILQLPFIIPLSTSPISILPWKSVTMNQMVCLNQCVDRETMWFASFDRYICNNEHLSNDFFDYLQISKQFSNDHLVTQLLYISNLYCQSSSISIDIQTKLTTVCFKIYQQIFNGSPLSATSENYLKTEKLIFMNNIFISISQLYLQPLEANYPNIYTLSSSLSCFYNAFKTLGAKEKMGKQDYIYILNYLHTVNKTSPLPSASLDIAITICQKLTVFDLTKEDFNKLFLPAQDGTLQSVSSLSYMDSDWASKTRNKTPPSSLIHKNISLEVSKHLHVFSVRTKNLTKSNLKFKSQGFGQHEPLTRRIKDILDQYPAGPTILYEMIQNADDAHAERIEFCLDLNDYGTDSLLSPELALWQGPALLVYNSGVFSDQDLNALQEISCGHKKEIVGTTGRFGLGINSVYHITDVPFLVTRDRFIILDPHQKYAPVEGEPGLMIKFHEQSLTEDFSDQISPFQFFGCDIRQNFNGTLFRFPLRNREALASSDISKKPFGIDNILEAFEVLKRNINHSLIFLNHIKQINVSIIPPSFTTPLNLFTTVIQERSLTEYNWKRLRDIYYSKDNKVSRTEFFNYLKQYRGRNIPNHIEMKQLLTSVSDLFIYIQNHKDEIIRRGRLSIDSSDIMNKVTKIVEKNSVDYLISTCMGGDTILDICTEEKNNELKLIPVCAVAAVLHHNTADEWYLSSPSPSLYCTLPLPNNPLKDSIHVDINGFFELSSNRRDIWQGTDVAGNSQVKIEWNNILLHEVLSRALLALFEFSTECYIPDDSGYVNYWNLLPSVDYDSPWKEFVKGVYEYISEYTVFTIENELKESDPPYYQGNQVVVYKEEDHYICSEKDQEVLLQLPMYLMKEGVKISMPISSIASLIRLYSSKIDSVIPEYILRHYMSQRLPKKMLQTNIYNKILLLFFNEFEKSRNIQFLNGFPLYFINDKSVECVNKHESKLYIMCPQYEVIFKSFYTTAIIQNDQYLLNLFVPTLLRTHKNSSNSSNSVDIDIDDPRYSNQRINSSVIIVDKETNISTYTYIEKEHSEKENEQAVALLQKTDKLYYITKDLFIQYLSIMLDNKFIGDKQILYNKIAWYPKPSSGMSMLSFKFQFVSEVWISTLWTLLATYEDKQISTLLNKYPLLPIYEGTTRELIQYSKSTFIINYIQNDSIQSLLVKCGIYLFDIKAYTNNNTVNITTDGTSSSPSFPKEFTKYVYMPTGNSVISLLKASLDKYANQKEKEPSILFSNRIIRKATMSDYFKDLNISEENIVQLRKELIPLLKQDINNIQNKEIILSLPIWMLYNDRNKYSSISISDNYIPPQRIPERLLTNRFISETDNDIITFLKAIGIQTLSEIDYNCKYLIKDILTLQSDDYKYGINYICKNYDEINQNGCSLSEAFQKKNLLLNRTNQRAIKNNLKNCEELYYCEDEFINNLIPDEIGLNKDLCIPETIRILDTLGLHTKLDISIMCKLIQRLLTGNNYNNINLKQLEQLWTYFDDHSDDYAQELMNTNVNTSDFQRIRWIPVITESTNEFIPIQIDINRSDIIGHKVVSTNNNNKSILLSNASNTRPSEDLNMCSCSYYLTSYKRPSTNFQILLGWNEAYSSTIYYNQLVGIAKYYMFTYYKPLFSNISNCSIIDMTNESYLDFINGTVGNNIQVDISIRDNIENIIYPLYEQLNNSINTDHIKHYSPTAYWIWNTNRFYSSSVCRSGRIVEYQPYIQEISSRMKEYRNITRKLHISANKDNSFLFDFSVTYFMKRSLKSSEIQFYLDNIIPAYRECLRTDSPLPNPLYLPNRLNTLTISGNLCYDDADDVSSIDSSEIVLADIDNELAEKLGCLSLLDRNAGAKKIEYNPCVTGHDLRRILSNYSHIDTILIDLIEVFEYLGMTNISFYFDTATYTNGKLLNNSLTPLQGPALCVYIPSNCFDMKTFISSMNESTTLSSPYGYVNSPNNSKIGAGLFTCFHISDCIQYIYNKEIGFIDPEGKYNITNSTINNNGSSLSSVRPFDEKDINMFDAQFAPFLNIINVIKNHSQGNASDLINNSGAILRLPLRMQASSYCSEVMTSSKMTGIMNDFINRCSLFLLTNQFLSSLTIATIDNTTILSSITSTSNKEQLIIPQYNRYSMRSSNNNNIFSNVTDSVKSMTVNISESKTIKYLNVSRSSTNNRYFTIYYCYPRSGDNPCAKEGVVYIAIEKNQRQLPISTQGYVFFRSLCTSQITNLPFHIGGDFYYSTSSCLFYFNRILNSSPYHEENEKKLRTIITYLYPNMMQTIATSIESQDKIDRNDLYTILIKDPSSINIDNSISQSDYINSLVNYSIFPRYGTHTYDKMSALYVYKSIQSGDIHQLILNYIPIVDMKSPIYTLLANYIDYYNKPFTVLDTDEELKYFHNNQGDRYILRTGGLVLCSTFFMHAISQLQIVDEPIYSYNRKGKRYFNGSRRVYSDHSITIRSYFYDLDLIPTMDGEIHSLSSGRTFYRIPSNFKPLLTRHYDCVVLEEFDFLLTKNRIDSEVLTREKIVNMSKGDLVNLIKQDLPSSYTSGNSSYSYIYNSYSSSSKVIYPLSMPKNSILTPLWLYNFYKVFDITSTSDRSLINDLCVLPTSDGMLLPVSYYPFMFIDSQEHSLSNKLYQEIRILKEKETLERPDNTLLYANNGDYSTLPITDTLIPKVNDDFIAVPDEYRIKSSIYEATQLVYCSYIQVLMIQLKIPFLELAYYDDIQKVYNQLIPSSESIIKKLIYYISPSASVTYSHLSLNELTEDSRNYLRALCKTIGYSKSTNHDSSPIWKYILSLPIHLLLDDTYVDLQECEDYIQYKKNTPSYDPQRTYNDRIETYNRTVKSKHDTMNHILVNASLIESTFPLQIIYNHIIKADKQYFDLYSSYGIPIYSLSELLLRFYLPTFSTLSEETQILVLEHIRSNWSSLRGQTKLLNTLRDTPLLYYHNEYKCIYYFVNPSIDLLQDIYKEKEYRFPPGIYSNKEWIPMFKDLGMVYTITKEVFMEAAIELAKYANKPSAEILNLSMRLCDVFNENVDDYNDDTFFNTIASVRFVPCHMPSIYNQCSIEKDRIYSESVKPIISNELCPENTYYNKVGIHSPPDFPDFLKHFKNMLPTYDDEDEEDKTCYYSILSQWMYTTKPDEYYMSIYPSRVFNYLPCSLSPVLFAIPDEYFPLITLFHNLKVAQKPTVSQYIEVLIYIQKCSKEQMLSVNKTKCVSKLLSLIFEDKEMASKLTSIPVLTINNTLLNSSDCYYDDLHEPTIYKLPEIHLVHPRCYNIIHNYIQIAMLSTAIEEQLNPQFKLTEFNYDQSLYKVFSTINMDESLKRMISTLITDSDKSSLDNKQLTMKLRYPGLVDYIWRYVYQDEELEMEAKVVFIKRLRSIHNSLRQYTILIVNKIEAIYISKINSIHLGNDTVHLCNTFVDKEKKIIYVAYNNKQTIQHIEFLSIRINQMFGNPLKNILALVAYFRTPMTQLKEVGEMLFGRNIDEFDKEEKRAQPGEIVGAEDIMNLSYNPDRILLEGEIVAIEDKESSERGETKYRYAHVIEQTKSENDLRCYRLAVNISKNGIYSNDLIYYYDDIIQEEEKKEDEEEDNEGVLLSSCVYNICSQSVSILSQSSIGLSDEDGEERIREPTMSIEQEDESLPSQISKVSHLKCAETALNRAGLSLNTSTKNMMQQLLDKQREIEKLDQLIKEREKSRNKDNHKNSICQICYQNEIDTFVDPCGHVICSSCSHQLKQVCPFCKQRVQGYKRVYF
ncbi:hypothetical protein WA158_007972 [Blastocystis sp. Blastoise]